MYDAGNKEQDCEEYRSCNRSIVGVYVVIYRHDEMSEAKEQAISSS